MAAATTDQSLLYNEFPLYADNVSADDAHQAGLLEVYYSPTRL